MELRELIASNIRKNRKRLGLTQADLAERVDLSLNAIGNYESCRQEPTAKVRKMICLALGINELDLVKQEIIDVKNEQSLGIIEFINGLKGIPTDVLLELTRVRNDKVFQIIREVLKVSTEKTYKTPVKTNK